VWSVGLAGESEQSLYDLPLGDGPIALVVGSEEKGLAPLVRRRCDAVVSIPQHGSLPSLNVGVAGAVAAFEVARSGTAPASPAEATLAARWVSGRPDLVAPGLVTGTDALRAPPRSR
jgi:hypothetical protein